MSKEFGWFIIAYGTLSMTFSFIMWRLINAGNKAMTEYFEVTKKWVDTRLELYNIMLSTENKE